MKKNTFRVWLIFRKYYSPSIKSPRSNCPFASTYINCIKTVRVHILSNISNIIENYPFKFINIENKKVKYD